MVAEPELRHRVESFHIASVLDNWGRPEFAIYYAVRLHFVPNGFQRPPLVLLGHPFRLYP